MNEQDKAAFEAWLEANNFGPSWVMAENAWEAALAYRDSQPMVSLTRYETAILEIKCTDKAGNIDLEYFAMELQDALEAKNRRRG